VTPTENPETSRLTPAQLIALNADLELPRAAVCRLAGSTHSWWLGGSTVSDETIAGLGVSPAVIRAARSCLARAAEVAARERDHAEQLGARIITLNDDDYPPALDDLALPPPVLYLRGALPARPCLSIVGARKASAYGREVARAFGGELAARGFVIVSGFARGIDATAHRAAAEAETGATLAILGCGLDVDYPRGRRPLRRAVCRRGGLLSEFPLGAEPLPFNFPIRNRLIAALGHGTLVVEATAKSGSLITARLALELGRDIYAAPGRIFEPKAAGPNTLVRDGAFLVQHPDDIMITLPQAVLDRLRDPRPAEDQPSNPDLPARQARVLAALSPGTKAGEDELARRLDMPVTELLGTLLELELSGWVRREPGPVYARRELW